MVSLPYPVSAGNPQRDSCCGFALMTIFIKHMPVNPQFPHKAAVVRIKRRDGDWCFPVWIYLGNRRWTLFGTHQSLAGQCEEIL